MYENIREIEDIINIQKANGNFHAKQVVFALPGDGEGGGALPRSEVARSLESGLARAGVRRRAKRRRGKGRKPAPTDNVSWPSDSDITVLRMKSARGEGESRAGDGLHRPDPSSMVNLATLVLPAASESKHSLAQELLLPLSSWERTASPAPTPARPRSPSALKPPPATPEEADSAKSRFARFLRLYFCPCCTCLYEMEKNLRDEPSVYLTSTRRSLGAASD